MVPGVSDLVFMIRSARSQINESAHGSNTYSYKPGEHIVVGEISAKHPSIVYWHDVDCANAHSLEQHSQVLACNGAKEEVAMKYFVLDDISPRAIEVLGHNLGIDPAVFLQHLHQSLEGCPIESFNAVSLPTTGLTISPQPISTRAVMSPFAIRDMRSRFEKDQTHMVVCPADMYVVPTSDMYQRGVPIICSAFKERQLQRVPRWNSPTFDHAIVCQLGRRSFMMPSICDDFGPYLPVWPKPGDEAVKSHTPFQRITLDRSDHVILHVPGKTEVPAGKMPFAACNSKLLNFPVLVFRTPSVWNQPIDASDLESVHRELSGSKERWKVLGSPDHFQFNPIPNFVDMSPIGLHHASASNGGVDSNPQTPPRESGSTLGRLLGFWPNLALCKALTDWHMRCTGEDVLLKKVATPAHIYFLERALSRLRTVTDEDYKRVYDQCANDKLEADEKRRLLDYCRTRATRWERLELSNSRMLEEVRKSICQESEAAQESLKLCCDQVQCLAGLVEDQLRKTKEFVSLQLEQIAADQQRQLMHNQIELSQVQIAESRKAIQQAETMRKLTILAFVFIPASTICSFFGMNVKELDNYPRIWVFVTTLSLVIALVLMIATADGLLNLLMRIFAAMPVRPRGGEPDISQTRRWTAVFFFRAVHIPFALIWQAVLAMIGKWKLFVSQGRAYRTGYQDPDRLSDNESRNEAKDTHLYVQKGALTSWRAKEKLNDYRRSWTEFWKNLAGKKQNNAASNLPVSSDLFPAPNYITGAGVRSLTELHQ